MNILFFFKKINFENCCSELAEKKIVSCVPYYFFMILNFTSFDFEAASAAKFFQIILLKNKQTSPLRFSLKYFVLEIISCKIIKICFNLCIELAGLVFQF